MFQLDLSSCLVLFEFEFVVIFTLTKYFHISSFGYFYLNFAVTLFNFQGTCLRGFTLMVGSSGLEPPTLRLSGVRSNHLSYEPIRNELRSYS